MPPSSAERHDLRRTALIATLRQTRMFADLGPEDIAAVAEACTVRTLAKDEALFREGDRSEGFYIAQSGSVSVFKVTPDGREQIICVFRAPESFAEATLATVETYPANAVALEPARIIVVQRAPFRELLRRKPELSLQMLGSMSLHLKHLVQTLQDYKGRPIEGRLVDWLLRHLPAGADALELPVTKKNLAGQLGVTSETLSRTLARFRDENLIRVDGPRIHFLDQAGLRAYQEPAI